MLELERSTRTRVVFAHPFESGAHDTWLPAGSYKVDAGEELLPGLSFIAYRRTRTTITLPALEQSSQRQRQVITIEAASLEAASARHAASSEAVRSAQQPSSSATTERKTNVQIQR